jgi:hypothetical protein
VDRLKWPHPWSITNQRYQRAWELTGRLCFTAWSPAVSQLVICFVIGLSISLFIYDSVSTNQRNQ